VLLWQKRESIMTQTIMIRTHPSKLRKVDIPLSNTVSIDGYMTPKGEFWPGIAAISLLRGYGKDRFKRSLRSEARKKLKAFGYESPKSFKQFIAETLASNKQIIFCLSDFSPEKLNSCLRRTLQPQQRTPKENRPFFDLSYDEFLEALAENQAELAELRLPGDDLYYPQ
jgi:hypothetical protein